MVMVWGRSACLVGFPIVAGLMIGIAPARADLDTPIDFNMPAGDLASTLVAISRQGRVMISFPSEIVAGRSAAALQGRLSAREALARVLAGSGLRLVPGAGGSLTIVRDAGPGAKAAPAGDIAAIDVTDESPMSRFGDVGFQAGDAGPVSRLGNTPAKELPISISAVTSEVIRSQVVTTATDAVQNVAGVNIGASNPNAPTFTIRGFKTDGVTIDGQRVVGLGNGGFGQVPVDDVERVEVLKGPSSILSGASGNGGAVNLSTKQPSNTEVRSATIRYGSFNYRTLALDLGGPVAGTEGLTYRLNMSGNMADENYAGYRNQYEYLISPVVKWTDGDTTILAGLRYFDQSRGPIQYSFIPRNSFDLDPNRPILRIPRGTTQVNPDLHYRTNTVSVYSNQSHDFGDVFGLNIVANNRIRYETSSDDVNGFTWLTTKSPGAPAGTWRARQLYSPYTFSRLINQSDLTMTYDAGFARQTSKIGIDYSSINLNLTTNTSSIFDINPLTGFPQQPLFRGPDGPATTYDSNRGTGLGYYYIEKFDTLDDRLHIFGQVRHDENKYITQSAERGVTRISPFSTSGLSWTAGAAFDVTPYFTVYGNRSIGFIPQYAIVVETGQTAPPENRDQVEMGGRFFLFDKKLTLTANYFDLSATNVAVCDAIRGCNFVELVAGQTSKGFEFEIQGELFPGFNIIGAFSSIKAKNVSTQTATALNAIPQYTASLWGSYRFREGPLEGLTLGLGARGNSNSFTSLDLNSASKFRIPGYITADAAIGYDIDRWSLQLKLNNIFDKYAYLPSYSSNFIGIAPGRNVMFQARYNFE